MQMIHCPNCGRLTGFKRSLGFGTFFMVLLTFGLWLLVIPFYPLRCINCGLKSIVAQKTPWYRPGDTGSKIVVTAIGLFVLVVLVQAILHIGSRSPEPTESAAAPQVKQFSNNAAQGIQDEPKQEPTLTPHQQRLAALREKRDGIETAIAIERDTIAKVLRDEGPQGVPEDEHERVQRLIQEKEVVDAAIKEEEGDSEPEPSPPTVLKTLPHHQVDETFSVGYWTYHCEGMRWLQFLGNGSSQEGRSETGFAAIYLTMRNDDDSPSIAPPIRLVDSDAREYDPSPKALLQSDALDLTARLDATASAHGSVIFEVPQGGTYFLEVSGGMMSNQLALIDLKTEPQSGGSSQEPTQTSASSGPSAAQSSADVALILKAAEQGDAHAQSKLGMMYHNGGGVPQGDVQAVSWWRKAAEQGDARAQTDLGVSYQFGRGVPQDDVQAIRWLEKAVAQGYAMAQDDLGLSYGLGRGVPQDYAQAVYWFRKAAEQGYALAQDHLSVMYHNGQGVPQDYAESYFWIAVAASGKIEGVKQEDVEKVRDKEASNLTPAELSQVQERMRKWLEDHPSKAP